jgi:hypothetical protein
MGSEERLNYLESEGIDIDFPSSPLAGTGDQTCAIDTKFEVVDQAFRLF